MLKNLYLLFAVVLIGGTIFMMTQPKTESGNVAILLCSIVGALCGLMYFFVDKLKKQN
jgi:uncharacterized membrane protein